MSGFSASAGRTPPRALRRFAHVNRYWDNAAQAWIAQVLPGEFYVSIEDELISTVLGSCVSACIRDTRLALGGINHFMLPDDPGNDTAGEATRYGYFALESLINELLKNGGRRETLEIKVFGGGKVMGGLGDVGRSNVEFVRKYLRDEGLAVAAEDVLGTVARRLRYNPRTGKTLVKHMEMAEAKEVVTREVEHKKSLKKAPITGDVELF